MTDLLFDNGNLTVFEMYLSELLKVFLSSLRNDAPVKFSLETKNISSSTRNRTKGLLQQKNCRIFLRDSLSLAGLFVYDIRPKNITTLHFMQYHQKLVSLYVIDNRHL